MNKLKAYWLRFWHCLIWTARQPGVDHRMEISWNEGFVPCGDLVRQITHIGCACGKVYYGVKPQYFNEQLDKNKQNGNKHRTN